MHSGETQTTLIPVGRAGTISSRMPQPRLSWMDNLYEPLTFTSGLAGLWLTYFTNIAL